MSSGTITATAGLVRLGIRGEKSRFANANSLRHLVSFAGLSLPNGHAAHLSASRHMPRAQRTQSAAREAAREPLHRY